MRYKSKFSSSCKEITEELAQLLSYANKRENVEELAERLSERYGNLGSMSGATPEELENAVGAKPNAALMLKLLGGIASRRVTDCVTPGEKMTDIEIEEYLKGVFMGVGIETLYMLCLDGKGRLISTEFVGEGTISSSDVYPRRLVESAIKKSAHSVILAHNHPRGVAEPSDDDLTTTNLLSEIFNNAGIRLLCHYIVAADEICRINGFLISG